MILVENGLKGSSFLHTLLVWMQLIPPNEDHCLPWLQIAEKNALIFLDFGDCEPEALQRDQSELDHYNFLSI